MSATAIENELDPAVLEVEFADVMQMTREVFGHEPRIESYPDPEIAGLTLINFCVSTAFDSQQLIAKLNQWHERLEELRPIYDRRLGISWGPIE